MMDGNQSKRDESLMDKKSVFLSICFSRIQQPHHEYNSHNTQMEHDYTLYLYYSTIHSVVSTI